MAMMEDKEKAEFELLLEIAYNAASIYNFTKSDSPEEAIMKLNIFGQTDRANEFEKQIKFVNDMYRNDNKILPMNLWSKYLVKEITEK